MSLTNLDPTTTATVSQPRVRRSRRWLTIGLAALLLASLVVLTFTWQSARANERSIAADVAATSAGRTAVEHMMTYDYRSLDQDFDWVRRDGTPSFRGTFDAVSQSVKKLAEATRASSVVKITGVAGEVKDDNHATVLAFADQTVAEAGRRAKSAQRWRVEVSMVRQGGRWLVDKVTLR
jgi:Mce-associated membrane protein